MGKEGRVTRPAFLPAELPFEDTEVTQGMLACPVSHGPVPNEKAVRGWKKLASFVLWHKWLKLDWHIKGTLLRMIKERGQAV